MAETNNCKAATEWLNLLHHQLQLRFKDKFIFPLFAFPFYLPSQQRKHSLLSQLRLERGFRDEEKRVSASGMRKRGYLQFHQVPKSSKWETYPELQHFGFPTADQVGRDIRGNFLPPSCLCTTLSHHLFTMSQCRVSCVQGKEGTPGSPSGLRKNLKGLQNATEIANILGINARRKSHYFIISKTHRFQYGIWKKWFVQYTVQYIAHINGLHSCIVPRHFLHADVSTSIRLPKRKATAIKSVLHWATEIAWQLRTECRSLNLVPMLKLFYLPSLFIPNSDC